jgi:tetratricopeptide (TPR) repeat protein
LRAEFLIPICLVTAMPAAPQVQPPQAQPPQVQPRFDAPGPATARARRGGQLDSNETLFTVLAAINAAGYDAEIANEANSPLRKAVRDHLKTLDLPVLEELRRFVRQHHQTDAGADLSQYISYSLTVNGPPDFGPHYNSAAVPPDVDSLLGLTPLIAQFYKEANIADLYRRVQRPYDQSIEQLQRPVVNAVLQVNAYLRQDTAGYLGRRFQIYVDLMGAPNQVQTRSYVDDYFVVLTPAPEVPVDQIRHAYLHYLLDILPLKYSQTVASKHALGDYALASPVLEEQYKSDFMLLTTECLIKAIESRLDRKPAAVDEALHEGFVLTPAISELLPEFEKQEQSMRLYFPAMIDAIDLRREEKRLDHIAFAHTRSNLKVKSVTREIAPAPLTGVEKTLDEAEKAYIARDLPHAHETFLRALRETDVKSAHAKAYYGLARISLLEKDPAKADELFRVVLDQDPDAETKSWSLLYLGRLADSQGWREEAVAHYKAALAVPGLPDSVRKAAEQGLNSAFTNK